MFKTLMTTFGIGIGIAVIIAVVVLMPLLSIWAANTLFPSLAIPYTFETWAATVLLGMFIRGDKFVSVSK